MYSYKSSSNITTYVFKNLAMSITTYTSSEFSRDVSRAKTASNSGPVFITNRNKPKHELLSIDEYQRLKSKRSNLVDALSMQGLTEIEFKLPRTRIESIQTILC